MKSKHKYVFTYQDFLVEQDLSAPLMPEAAPAQSKAPTLYHFLFMTGSDDTGNGRRRYPDGSVVIEYPCYSVDEESLTNWVNDNIVATDKVKLNSSELEIRRKNIIKIVKGDRVNISNDDLPFIEKLKNAVSSNILGRPEPDVTVIFSDDVPTTTNINVTFIKHKK